VRLTAGVTTPITVAEFAVMNCTVRLDAFVVRPSTGLTKIYQKYHR